MALRAFAGSIAALVCATTISVAQIDHAGHGSHGGVGKIAFANSCSPAVQEDLARAVAMLHSFWYSAGEQTFREVLARDPACGVATWGIAALLMSNPLAGAGSTPKDAEKAQE